MNNAHVIACAEVFRGDGEILASAIGAVPRAGAELARATFEPDLVLTDGVAHAIDAEGRVVEGAPDQVNEVTDVWTFSRDTRSQDPNWALAATQSPD